MAICCNKDWGMGTNIKENGYGASYGYPEDSDPHKFYPDHECCTEQEIERWNRAKEAWKLDAEKDWEKGNL